MSRFAWLLLAAACAPAQAADWRMDAADSRLEFIVTFEKTPAPGVFKSFDTRMSFEADKPEAGRLEVTIQVTSADLGIADVNAAIRGPEWFDFARHPRADFRATEIRRAGEGYLARGTLSLKGAQQAVEVPFTWRASGDTAMLEGELTVKRGAFGIGTGEWAATDVIGADVRIKFRVRLRKAG